jgi:uncharacterized protein YdhG (YjbR/CyaY superfamily)
MANTDFKSVDEYLAKQPERVRAVVQRVRGIIKKALPDADEVISYQIPTYKLSGSAVLYLAGWKEHFSLYPITPALSEDLGKELEPYVAGKGTLRFPLAEPIPIKLIARIATLRGKEAAERAKLKATRGRVKAGARTTRAKAVAKKVARKAVRRPL